MDIRFRHFDRDTTLRYGITRKSSSLPFDGSLALHTGEEVGGILRNRQEIAARYGFEGMHIVLANQTHSDRVVTVEKATTRGWYEHDSAVPACDALITALPNVCLGILTADCVPILLYDPVRRVIAAVHAGWKGSAQDIVVTCIETMRRTYGCDPSHMWAGIGPSIRGCCYEVDDNVARHFRHIRGALQAKEKGKAMLDLSVVNRSRLLDAGVQPERIEIAPYCTACDTERFFSYRKERCTGRFLSFIAMKR